MAGWRANNVDPDQTPHSAASDLGLHFLLWSDCLNTSGKYGMSSVRRNGAFTRGIREQKELNRGCACAQSGLSTFCLSIYSSFSMAITVWAHDQMPKAMTRKSLSTEILTFTFISDVFAIAKPQTDFLNPGHSFPYFPKSHFRLIGMACEACLPSTAYFPLTPDYTPFILGPCLSVWTFLILALCISTSWFFRNTILIYWPQTNFNCDF